MEPGQTRKLEWRARRDDVKPAFRVEHVAEGEQVALVGAAPVMQHEQTCRLTLRRPLAKRQRS